MTRSGRASDARSQSVGSRPRSTSRRDPPTTYAAWLFDQRLSSTARTATGIEPSTVSGRPIADEDLAARQLHARSRPADEVLEADDGRRAILGPRRPDHLVVVFDHFGLLAEHETEGARQVADVERFVVLVQNEHDTVHWAG